MLLQHPVHQQQAPTIRQRIIEYAMQALEIRASSCIGVSIKGHGVWCQIKAVRQPSRGVLKHDVAMVFSQLADKLTAAAYAQQPADSSQQSAGQTDDSGNGKKKDEKKDEKKVEEGEVVS